MLLELLVIAAFVGGIIGYRFYKKKGASEVIIEDSVEPGRPIEPIKQKPELAESDVNSKAKPAKSKSSDSKSPKSGDKKAPARRSRNKKPKMTVIK
jgi:hypothetical protein